MTDQPPASPAEDQQRRTPRGALVAIAAAGTFLLLIGGLIAWAIWVSSGNEPPRQIVPDFGQYRAGWESAMRKAGVEATFPAGPVELTGVRATGMHSFSATFTAEEITALLNVYRFSRAVQGREVSILEADVAFPAAGQASLTGRLGVDRTSYRAIISAPVSYSNGAVRSSGPARLRVSGFDVGGARLRQAMTAVLGYVNAYVKAAPGLVVTKAEIIEGGLYVEGSAPYSLEHPEPIPE